MRAEGDFSSTPLTVEGLCRTLGAWPAGWAYDDCDLVPGRELVEIFYRLLGELHAEGLAPTTLRRHRSNLHLLGSTVIQSLHRDPDRRSRSMRELLADEIGDGAGPLLDRHSTYAEQLSFDATCRKVFRRL